MGLFVLIITILVIYGLYGALILGAIAAFRKIGLSARLRIFIGFLLMGVVAGAISTVLWPADSSVIFNIPASLIGDKLYVSAINTIGDISSPHAHYTIPWILRIPQVYFIVSVVFWGIIGLLAQLVSNHRTHLRASHQPSSN